ncbi:rhodanese-like domain-containing protein [Desulfuromonas sp. TF]|uniref:rhodanese-like domain-containing protein n=1 Tax=Desulfuromonas sp. TF TaxID=1232410 RepID=UPI000414C17D|nr:rhodanese-like domain-containing protein [Desulfuromonas sp. TF]
MKKIMLIIAVLLVAFSATGAFANDWFKDNLTVEKAAVTFTREVERGGYQIVTTEELKDWIDTGKPMLIIDTMPYEASYKKNHIPGAVPFEFPIPEMAEIDDSTKVKFLELLGPDKNRQIVFYCGFTKCTRSHNGAMWAKNLGYTNVYRHPGGILAWKQAGYPVKSVK